MYALALLAWCANSIVFSHINVNVLKKNRKQIPLKIESENNIFFIADACFQWTENYDSKMSTK